MKDDKKGLWKKCDRIKNVEHVRHQADEMIVQKITVLIKNYVSQANSRKCCIANVPLHLGFFILGYVLSLKA